MKQMKSANGFSFSTLWERIKNWHGRVFPDVKAGWQLYTAVWRPATGIAGVLLVLPYLLLAFMALRTAAYDMGQLTQLMTGISYTADWNGMMYNQIRALSSYSSLISYAVQIALLPGACAALALLYGARWRGQTLPINTIWGQIKPRLLSIIITGLMAMFAMNLLRFAVNIVTGLLGMVASLLSMIPVVGTVLMVIIYIVSIVLTLALILALLTLLMFAMHGDAGVGYGIGFQSIMAAVRVVWGGRRDIFPTLIWLLCALTAGLLGCALIFGITSALLGTAAGAVITVLLAAAAAAVGIPALCACLTTLYMNEQSRMGDTPFAYADFFNGRAR